MKKPGGILLLVAGLLIGVVSGCGTPGAEQKTSPAPELMVFAGAGLKDALPEVANLYLQSHPGIKISFNFAGSGTLQKQIEQGAPADIVIFPGKKQMDTLEKESLIDKATRRKILADKLVIITPKESGKVKDFADLASPGVGKVSIGDPDIVPAGEWAKETLVNLGLWDKVNAKLVLAKDVQQVKTYVETGNVDAGLVWRSTAATSSKIRIMETMPDHLHISLSAPLTVAPTGIVRKLKNITANKIFSAFPGLKKKYFWGSGMWSRGYYIGTAGNVSAETIRKYIEAQKSFRKEVKPGEPL